MSDKMDQNWRYTPESVWIAGTKFAPVLTVVAHQPGQHPEKCPIVSNLTAVELVTKYGSRWWGFEEAMINSELRFIVRGFPKHDEVRAAWRRVPPSRAP